MIDFLSLGANLCPVDLDIDRKQLENDIDVWVRRLRLRLNFKDSEDLRTEEEKRFYTASGWTPQPGKNLALDLFIFQIQSKFDEGIQPARIKDNMTVSECKGMEMVNNDSDNIYRLEDKGSCIVRLSKKDYENNVVKNLNKADMFEEVDKDKTEILERKVVTFVNKLSKTNKISEKTAEYILSNTKKPF